jgi:hypothetical protein
MSEFSITPDVYEKINDMGESYVYNDADFISAGETNGGTVNGTDSGGVNSEQLRNYVAKTGDQMSGNLLTPLVQLNTLVFSDDSSMTTAVDNNDVQSSKTKTTQITYDGTSTNITNLTTGNFNTTFLSNMTENIQNAINTLKTKTTGISYNNSVTTISNLNATTFTAGNINVNHLNATNSNLQSQITSINSTLSNLTISHLNATSSNLQSQINGLQSQLNSLATQGAQYTIKNVGITTINVPVGVRWISILTIGGGGSAGMSSYYSPLAQFNNNASASGGSGGGISKIDISSYNISQITATVGSGGIAPTDVGDQGNDGLPTFVTINGLQLCYAGNGLGGRSGRSNGDWDTGGGAVVGGYGNLYIGGSSASGAGKNNNGAGNIAPQGEGTQGGSSGGSLVRNANESFVFGNGRDGSGLPLWLGDGTTIQGGSSGTAGYNDRYVPKQEFIENPSIIGFYCGGFGSAGARYTKSADIPPPIPNTGHGGSSNGCSCSGIPSITGSGASGLVQIQFYY